MFVSRLRATQAVRGFAAVALIAVLAVAGCALAGQTPSQGAGQTAGANPHSARPTIATFKLTSTAYAEGDEIPVKYSCYGDNVSPPLAWSDAPAETAALVLIMEDYASGFTHWVVYNIAGGSSGSLPEGYSRLPSTHGQAVPFVAACPGPGFRSSLNITLYALPAPLALTDAQTRNEVEDAMLGKVMAQATLMGWFTAP